MKRDTCSSVICENHAAKKRRGEITCAGNTLRNTGRDHVPRWIEATASFFRYELAVLWDAEDDHAIIRPMMKSSKMICWILNGHDVVPATLEQWGQFADDQFPERRMVATSEHNGVSVTTLFFGVTDPKLGPVLFETIVLRDGKAIDRARYSTWNEAVLGHAKMVAIAAESSH